MAYRRKQGGLSRSSTFKEEGHDHDITTSSSSSSSTAPSSPLARRTNNNANSPSSHSPATFRSSSSFKERSSGSPTYDYTLMRSTNEAGGFWGVLARKAKSILDDRQQPLSPTSPHKPHSPTTFSPTNHQSIQYQNECYSKKYDSPTSRNGVDRSFTSFSLHQLVGNALEEAGKKSEDKIQETSAAAGNWKIPTFDDEEKNYGHEPIKELNATRHVAIKTADKAKQLLRELKSVKADLAVAIRDQLETLLAEKGVLAHENSVYARENRYLREIVEFHQLSMQHHHMLMSSFEQQDNIVNDDDILLSSLI
ncbi:hypothetical protein OSB04_022993 [Centaurea solstitialis]|uniref:Uncharacterized protein n=1 Tax=Centaurea solstitialis TaxID=347529 RepID=A0AA38SWM7_9ASTR|nr:hypothetical protein OSB04_022993 [Centaurea solstitialis]